MAKPSVFEQGSDVYQVSWPHVLLVLKGERGEVLPRSLAEQGFESSRARLCQCVCVCVLVSVHGEFEKLLLLSQLKSCFKSISPRQ